MKSVRFVPIVVLSLIAAWVPQVAAQVEGSGKPNYIPIWSNSKRLTNSSIFETSGGKVGINTATPAAWFFGKTQLLRGRARAFPLRLISPGSLWRSCPEAFWQTKANFFL